MEALKNIPDFVWWIAAGAGAIALIVAGAEYYEAAAALLPGVGGL